MAHATSRLSDSQVRHAQPQSKEYQLADGGGLNLRILPVGTKTWLFNYQRPGSKKRTNMSFGPYPEVTLAAARQLRLEAYGLVQSGIDPQSHRLALAEEAACKSQNTFGHYLKRWHELKLEEVLKKTADKAYRRVELHALPKLSEFHINDLRPKHVVEALTPLAKARKRDTLKSICRTINEIMYLAKATGDIEMNRFEDLIKLFPKYGAKPPACQPSIPTSELPHLMARIGSARIMRRTRLLILWQMLTMTRPIEAVTAQWEHIDWDAKLWRIPAEIMKMKRDHVVPLSEPAIAILRELHEQRMAWSPYVFWSSRSKLGHVSSQTVNMALKRMGFQGRLVAHGLRSLASSALNAMELDPEAIERCLAHTDRNEVRAIYNRHEYIDEKRVVLNAWSEYLKSAATALHQPRQYDDELMLISA